MHVLTRVYACVSVYVGEWIQGTASQLAEWQSSIKQTISKDTLGRLAAWAPWKQAPPNTSLLLVQKGRAHCGSGGPAEALSASEPLPVLGTQVAVTWLVLRGEGQWHQCGWGCGACSVEGGLGSALFRVLF